jgi:SAM-dependent methyltransferase
MSQEFANVLIFLLLGFQVLLILALLFLLSLVVNALLTVPWVPTGRKIGRRMYELVGLKPGERVLDLGCGDGSLLLTAAKEFGARGVGYEIHPGLVWLAKLRAAVGGASSQVEYRRGNFYKADLPDADVIATYLFSEVQEKLEPILKARFPSGTRVVSRTFVYPTLPLVYSETFMGERINVYRIP